MIQDEGKEDRGLSFSIGRTDIDINIYPTQKEIGLGIMCLFDGPFEYQKFGIHIHLIAIMLQVDFFRIKGE